MAKPKQKSLRTIRIEQSAAAEILMDFMFTKNMDEVVIERYGKDTRSRTQQTV